MPEMVNEPKLQDGTLIRHRAIGYEGRIEGITEIKTCFTERGALLSNSNTKQTFQYRVVIQGEPMRRIAPIEDLEILEAVVEIVCPRCHTAFRSKPGLADKPRGRCQCGGWICPSCLACQETKESALCTKERKRLARKLIAEKSGKVKTH